MRTSSAPVTARACPRETADSIARTGVALKGPLATPVGFGEKSANVTLRKLFETYANIRPARQLPGVPTRYDGEGIDFIVVRENIEDLYAWHRVHGLARRGHRPQDHHPASARRRSSATPSSWRVERVAARSPARPRSNILKLTEGLFKRVFEEMAPEYPEIEPQHLIIDNVAHQMAKDPAQFDIIVTTNLAGDIISDLASGLVGGLGFASSGNYGDGVAIFEAVHGSAPKYAGKNVINPTALILSSVMMLEHLGETEAAQEIEDAVFVTLEEGAAVTLDVARQAGDVEQATSTSGFADAIIANLGRAPATRYPSKANPPAVAPEPLHRWPARRSVIARHAVAGCRRLHRDGRGSATGRQGPGRGRRAGVQTVTDVCPRHGRLSLGQPAYRHGRLVALPFRGGRGGWQPSMTRPSCGCWLASASI